MDNPFKPEYEHPTVQEVLASDHPQEQFTYTERVNIVSYLAKKLGVIIEKPNIVEYFDLRFDFENGIMWRWNSSKTHSFQVINANRSKAKFYVFKVLLEKKGEWLSLKDFEKAGVNLKMLNIKSCEDIDLHMTKNIHRSMKVSDHEIFYKPRMWVFYDKENDLISIASDKI